MRLTPAVMAGILAAIVLALYGLFVYRSYELSNRGTLNAAIVSRQFSEALWRTQQSAIWIERYNYDALRPGIDETQHLYKPANSLRFAVSNIRQLLNLDYLPALFERELIERIEDLPGRIKKLSASEQLSRKERVREVDGISKILQEAINAAVNVHYQVVADVLISEEKQLRSTTILMVLLLAGFLAAVYVSYLYAKKAEIALATARRSSLEVAGAMAHGFAHTSRSILRGALDQLGDATRVGKVSEGSAAHLKTAAESLKGHMKLCAAMADGSKNLLSDTDRCTIGELVEDLEKGQVDGYPCGGSPLERSPRHCVMVLLSQYL